MTASVGRDREKLRSPARFLTNHRMLEDTPGAIRKLPSCARARIQQRSASRVVILFFSFFLFSTWSQIVRNAPVGETYSFFGGGSSVAAGVAPSVVGFRSVLNHAAGVPLPTNTRNQLELHEAFFLFFFVWARRQELQEDKRSVLGHLISSNPDCRADAQPSGKTYRFLSMNLCFRIRY